MEGLHAWEGDPLAAQAWKCYLVSVVSELYCALHVAISKGCESGPLSAESVDVSQYGTVFNAHLQACVERDMLPTASDLVELMMSKRLAAEASLLQTLLKKLVKQNFWCRAREIFRRKCVCVQNPISILWFPYSGVEQHYCIIIAEPLGEMRQSLGRTTEVAKGRSCILFPVYGDDLPKTHFPAWMKFSELDFDRLSFPSGQQGWGWRTGRPTSILPVHTVCRVAISLSGALVCHFMQAQ